MDTKIITCDECGNMVEICYCLCPFCGDTAGNCNCTEEELILGKNEIYDFSGNQTLIALKQCNQGNDFTNDSDLEFQRLEKWRIGRANFP